MIRTSFFLHFSSFLTFSNSVININIECNYNFFFHTQHNCHELLQPWNNLSFTLIKKWEIIFHTLHSNWVFILNLTQQKWLAKDNNSIFYNNILVDMYGSNINNKFLKRLMQSVIISLYMEFLFLIIDYKITGNIHLFQQF